MWKGVFAFWGGKVCWCFCCSFLCLRLCWLLGRWCSVVFLPFILSPPSLSPNYIHWFLHVLLPLVSDTPLAPSSLLPLLATPPRSLLPPLVLYSFLSHMDKWLGLAPIYKIHTWLFKAITSLTTTQPSLIRDDLTENCSAIMLGYRTMCAGASSSRVTQVCFHFLVGFQLFVLSPFCCSFLMWLFSLLCCSLYTFACLLSWAELCSTVLNPYPSSVRHHSFRGFGGCSFHLSWEFALVKNWRSEVTDLSHCSW